MKACVWVELVTWLAVIPRQHSLPPMVCLRLPYHPVPCRCGCDVRGDQQLERLLLEYIENSAVPDAGDAHQEHSLSRLRSLVRVRVRVR